MTFVIYIAKLGSSIRKILLFSLFANIKAMFKQRLMIAMNF